MWPCMRLGDNAKQFKRVEHISSFNHDAIMQFPEATEEHGLAQGYACFDLGRDPRGA